MSPRAGLKAGPYVRGRYVHLVLRRRYCTLAVSVAVPVKVNVQLDFLLPPLEQAPVHMAERPPETVNVICVLVANVADPLLPTVTLIPPGLEVTVVPLRPVAVTVSVAV
jgi:hypothetical protein